MKPMNFAFRHLAFSGAGALIDFRDPECWSSAEWRAVAEGVKEIDFTSDWKLQWHALYERLHQLESAEQRTAFDAKTVAQSAFELFTGMFPAEGLLSQNEAFFLPWWRECWITDDDDVLSLRGDGNGDLILPFAEMLLDPAEDLPPRAETFALSFSVIEKYAVPDTDVQKITQLFAAEAILNAEGALRAIHDNDGFASACWLSCAYQRLIDSANAVEQIARESSRQSKLARIRHEENYALKEMVLEWYRQHHNSFRSAEAAAEAALLQKLVPQIRYRTIRDWIASERRKLRSAGKP